MKKQQTKCCSDLLKIKTTEKDKIKDDYATPIHAWEWIKDLIPKNKIIYEPFYYDGQSGEDLKKLGFKNIIHKDIDFFEDNNIEYDMILSNPPFSIKQKVFKRLKELDKPFIIICPCSVLPTQFFQKLFKNQIQIIIPKKRISFGSNKKGAWFECFYYCYKMNLKKDITFL